MLNNLPMSYVFLIYYYFDKTKIWPKMASKGPLAPRILYTAIVELESAACTGLPFLLPGWHLCFSHQQII